MKEFDSYKNRMRDKIRLRRINKDEWISAMALTWRTFLKFEAADFTPEGVRNFYLFLTDTNLEKMFLAGEYLVMGAFYDDVMIGIAAVRNKNHLSLLFVDEKYHHLGVGSALVISFVRFIKTYFKKNTMTVESSPYAEGFYHRLGFVDDTERQSNNGLIFTPMTATF